MREQTSATPYPCPPCLHAALADTCVLACRDVCLLAVRVPFFYSTWVLVRRTRSPGKQAEEAFLEYDVDKDGKVSWAEWQGVMFHEDEQVGPRVRPVLRLPPYCQQYYCWREKTFRMVENLHGACRGAASWLARALAYDMAY